MARSEHEAAERLAAARAWGAIALGVLFILAQSASLGDPPLGRSPVVHLAAWWAWAILLLLFLAWGAGLFGGRGLGRLVNDETTVDNRRRAMGLGFWGAIIAAGLAYAATFYEPVPARDALRLVVTFAVAPALIRFGLLERRGLGDG